MALISSVYYPEYYSLSSEDDWEVDYDDYDLITIFYYPESNLFMDEEGYVIYDIFEFLDYFDILNLKEMQTSLLFSSAKYKNCLIEVLWFDDEDDEYERR